MKKYMTLIVAVTILAVFVAVPLAFAEAVDAVPAAQLTDLTQLLTKEVLATMAGMILLTAILTQGIKMLFLRNAEPNTVRTMAFVVAAVVTLIAKLIFSLPFEIADILIIPGNSLIIWWASMKGYEQIIGLPTTPAGNAETKTLH